ncbi:MAG: serine hydrolase [Patescibacteria group bacterium]
MNLYAQDLKEKLERIDQYVLHAETPSHTNIFPEQQAPAKNTMLTFKGFVWFLGILVIGVSVVAFFTQAVLLVFDKQINKTETIAAVQGISSSVPDMYVRADLQTPVFGEIETIATTTSTSTATTSTSTENFTEVSVPIRSVDLGIPGVSRIGYNDDVGEKALTDNINKYSESTLVLGGERNTEGKTIGGGDDIIDADSYSVIEKSIPPVLNSKAYLVADLETGEIIVEKNSETIYPIASVSKLMTALVAREKMDMQTVAIVSRDASRAYGAQGGLALGEKIRLRDLLFPLLMESSNDAAEVFADQYGHVKFIEEMNKKAISLEMYNTYYGDPSGLDPKNTSTPKDLLALARYIHMNDPEIYDMTRVKQFSIKGHIWYNGNRLLPMAGFAGGKNGYIDQARQTTVSLFDVNLAKGGYRTVVVVILRSDAKDNDVVRLINYLKKSVIYQVE